MMRILLLLIAMTMGVNFYSTTTYREPEKFNGSVLVFQAEKENPDKSEMEETESILEMRLFGMGYTEAEIDSGSDGKITVKVPSVVDTDSLGDLLVQTAELTFSDADGKVWITGDDIKSVTSHYGNPTEGTVTSIPYLQLEFTAEGQKKFKEATGKAASSSDGRNYINIKIDETIISSPTVSEEINSNTCIISGGFETREDAEELAGLIRAGGLPFGITLVEQYTVE